MNGNYGIISEIQRFCIHDGKGLRTTVFLKGCPLRCAWCSNPETQSSEKELMYFQKNCIGCGRCISSCPNNALSFDNQRVVVEKDKCDLCGKCEKSCFYDALKIKGEEMDVFEIIELLMKDFKFFEKSGGGLTISGGEPTSQPEFTKKLLITAGKLGINTAIETCALCRQETLLDIAEYCDEIFVDLKIADAAAHRKWTGTDNRTIVENIRILLKTMASKVNIRIPVIEGINTGYNDIFQIAKLLKDLYCDLSPKEIVIELMPYHRLGSGKYEALQMKYSLENLKPMSMERIEDIKNIFKENGITAVTL